MDFRFFRRSQRDKVEGNPAKSPIVPAPMQDIVETDEVSVEESVQTSEEITIVAPEALPAPLNIFENEDSDAIYEAAKKGIDTEIAKGYLLAPAKATKLSLFASAKDFHLYGRLEFEEAGLKKGKQTTQTILDRVHEILPKTNGYEENNQSILVRGGNLEVVGPHGTKLLIGKEQYNYGVGDHELHVTTGIVQELVYGGEHYFNALEAPAMDKETLDAAIADTLTTMELVLGITYDITKTKDQPQHLTVKLPSEKQIETVVQDISDDFGGKRPRVSFEDIGGQNEAKERLSNIALGIEHPEIYKKWGATLPTGLLFYGPPGTGKTLMAKALASEVKAGFYQVTPSDIFSKWLGQSEQRIQSIFDAAASRERSIIYFDEIDAITANRDGLDETTQRVMSIILQNIDGMKSHDNVLIVASTNRKDAIDPGMLRAGRLSHLIEVTLPNAEARQRIFDIHMESANKRADRPVFADEIDIATLAAATEGTVGADIAEVVRRTLEEKAIQESKDGKEPGLTTTEDLLAQIKQYER